MGSVVNSTQLTEVGLVQRQQQPLPLFLPDAASWSRLRHHPGGTHRRARVRGFQIVRGAELEAAQPARPSAAVVRHREGACDAAAAAAEAPPTSIYVEEEKKTLTS